MSMPNIPDIEPEISLTRDEAITLILVSIAMEEIALSHIINAEAEKIQKVLCTSKCIDDLVKIDDKVQEMLKVVVKKEMLLQFKLEETIKLIDKEKHHHHKKEREKEYDCYDKDNYDEWN